MNSNCLFVLGFPGIFGSALSSSWFGAISVILPSCSFWNALLSKYRSWLIKLSNSFLRLNQLTSFGVGIKDGPSLGVIFMELLILLIIGWLRFGQDPLLWLSLSFLSYWVSHFFFFSFSFLSDVFLEIVSFAYSYCCYFQYRGCLVSLFADDYVLYNNENYLQIDSTAQGPHMCSYVDIAIADSDKEALEYHLSSTTWKRFRDDAFVLWPHGREYLVLFL